MAIALSGRVEWWVPKMPLCQAVHTQGPGTPGHAHYEAQGHAALSLAKGQESRGSLELRVTSSPASGTQPPCRAALHLPRPLTPHSLPSSNPCTACSQARPLQHRLFPQQRKCLCISSSSLCFSATILCKSAWIPCRSLVTITLAAGSSTAHICHLVLLASHPAI